VLLFNHHGHPRLLGTATAGRERVVEAAESMIALLSDLPVEREAEETGGQDDEVAPPTAARRRVPRRQTRQTRP